MIDSGAPLDPQLASRNLFARSKAASEALLMEMHRERGLPLVIFRPGVVIGEGSPPVAGAGPRTVRALRRLLADDLLRDALRPQAHG